METAINAASLLTIDSLSEKTIKIKIREQFQLPSEERLGGAILPPSDSGLSLGGPYVIIPSLEMHGPHRDYLPL